MSLRGAGRIAVAVGLVAGLGGLAGCGSFDQSGLAPGTCITSIDCLSDPSWGTVCYHGACVVCAADTDCAQGLVCTNFRCVAP